MNPKIFLPFFFTTFLFSGYPALQVVRANPPLLIAQSVWKPFSSKDGGFTVLMPGQPTQENRTVKTEVGSIPVQAFSVLRRGEALYAVAYSDFPGNFPQNPRDIDRLLAQVASGFAQGAKGRLVSQQTIGLGNFPGREIRLQLDRGLIARGRLFVVNSRLYQVIVVTGQERNLTKSIEGFFKSFRLIDNATASKAPSPEELNTNLKQAVCRQNWSQALQIIDQMLAMAPSPDTRNQLVTYRERIQGLANSGGKIPPASLPDCSAAQ
jgi:hypothetical protein